MAFRFFCCFTIGVELLLAYLLTDHGGSLHQSLRAPAQLVVLGDDWRRCVILGRWFCDRGGIVKRWLKPV